MSTTGFSAWSMSWRRLVRASAIPAAKAPTIGAESAFLAPQATSSAKATAAAPSIPRTFDWPMIRTSHFPRGIPATTATIRKPIA